MGKFIPASECRKIAIENTNKDSSLDIGCGSGLHALAALILGAKEIVAVDIDMDSVETSRAVLYRYMPKAQWRAEPVSIFDISPDVFGRFDIVYFWGVLHHTGDMVRVLLITAILSLLCIVASGWIFSGVWKSVYIPKLPPGCSVLRERYICIFLIFVSLRRHYESEQGMDAIHNLHDWMGGWPYESISVHEVEVLMHTLGFTEKKIFAPKGRWFGRELGIFGSGCDEYVYEKSVAKRHEACSLR